MSACATRVKCYVAVLLFINVVNAHALPPQNVPVTVVSEAGLTKDIRANVQGKHLVGDYYVGDGLGYNLHLSLKEDGQFTCKWTGCLKGDYGTSSGAWTIRATGLVLAPNMAEGMLKDTPITQLRIISYQKSYLLLQEQDSDWFKKYGPDTFCCFHQKTAKKLLEDYRLRRIEREVNELIEKQKK